MDRNDPRTGVAAVEIYNVENIVILHDRCTGTFIAKITEIRQSVEQLHSQLQASEHDKFDCSY